MGECKEEINRNYSKEECGFKSGQSPIPNPQSPELNKINLS